METRETKDCSLPPPLTEDEVSAAADGRPSRHARAHLRRCTACSARVTEARQFESALGRVLHRFDCPPAQRLGDYVFGFVDDPEAAAISTHLQLCTRCSSEVSELRTLVADDPFEEQEHSEATNARAAARVRGPRVTLDDLIARLLPRSPALAYRGTTTGREPLVAEAGDTVITLDIQTSGMDHIEIVGLLATLDPEAWDGALALLWVEGEIRAAASLDENGGFTLGPLAPGMATLRITPTRGSAIVLTDLDLA